MKCVLRYKYVLTSVGSGREDVELSTLLKIYLFSNHSLHDYVLAWHK